MAEAYLFLLQQPDDGDRRQDLQYRLRKSFADEDRRDRQIGGRRRCRDRVVEPTDDLRSYHVSSEEDPPRTRLRAEAHDRAGRVRAGRCLQGRARLPNSLNDPRYFNIKMMQNHLQPEGERRADRDRFRQHHHLLRRGVCGRSRPARTGSGRVDAAARADVRDHLRAQPGGEAAWQGLQGWVYGKGHGRARRCIPGRRRFPAPRTEQRGRRLHRQPQDGERPSGPGPHRSARGSPRWMRGAGIDRRTDGYGLRRANRLFRGRPRPPRSTGSARSTSMSSSTISSMSFEQPHFPESVRPILFTNGNDAVRLISPAVAHWDDITARGVRGDERGTAPARDRSSAAASSAEGAATGPPGPAATTGCSASMRRRHAPRPQVLSATQRRSPRPPRRRNTRRCSFSGAHGIGAGAAADRDAIARGTAPSMTWFDGEAAASGRRRCRYRSTALSFLCEAACDAPGRAARALPDASEACLTPPDSIAQVERRFARLTEHRRAQSPTLARAAAERPAAGPEALTPGTSRPARCDRLDGRRRRLRRNDPEPIRFRPAQRDADGEDGHCASSISSISAGTIRSSWCPIPRLHPGSNLAEGARGRLIERLSRDSMRPTTRAFRPAATCCIPLFGLHLVPDHPERLSAGKAGRGVLAQRSANEAETRHLAGQLDKARRLHQAICQRDPDLAPERRSRTHLQARRAQPLSAAAGAAAPCGRRARPCRPGAVADRDRPRALRRRAADRLRSTRAIPTATARS